MKYYLFLPIVLLFGCSQKKKLLTWAADTPYTIKMERTACFGTCPIYSFTFSHKGHMDYNGLQFVVLLGEARAEVDPADVAAIRNMLQKIDWTQLPDSYPCNETDLPSVVLTLQSKNYKKRVEVACNGPAYLNQLIVELDNLHKFYMPNEVQGPPLPEAAQE